MYDIKSRMENRVPENSPHVSDGIIRVFAVLGFVAVLAGGMWGSVKIAEVVPGAFSSLAAAFVSLTSVFVPANQTLPLSAPATIAAGEPFTLSWTNANKNAKGSYTFRYDCAENLYFTSPSPSGQDANVYCNVPFNFLNANNSITLTPFTAATAGVPVTIYIDFTPNGATRASVTGKATLTVEPAATTTAPAATQTPSAPATPTTHTATPTAGTETTNTYLLNGPSAQPSNPNGYVDLKATIIGVGVVDKNSGAFFASSTPSLQEVANSGQYRIAVRFAIENVGTKTSPQFTFNAVLPTLPSHIFTSQTQRELAPGDRIEYTLGFDSFDASGSGIFTVNADPSGSINEPDKTNNIVHYTIQTTP